MSSSPPSVKHMCYCNPLSHPHAAVLLGSAGNKHETLQNGCLRLKVQAMTMEVIFIIIIF